MLLRVVHNRVFHAGEVRYHPSYLEQKDDAARRLAEPLGPTVREAVATAMAKPRRSETY